MQFCKAIKLSQQGWDEHIAVNISLVALAEYLPKTKKHKAYAQGGGEEEGDWHLRDSDYWSLSSNTVL